MKESQENDLTYDKKSFVGKDGEPTSAPPKTHLNGSIVQEAFRVSKLSAAEAIPTLKPTNDGSMPMESSASNRSEGNVQNVVAIKRRPSLDSEVSEHINANASGLEAGQHIDSTPHRPSVQFTALAHDSHGGGSHPRTPTERVPEEDGPARDSRITSFLDRLKALKSTPTSASAMHPAGPPAGMRASFDSVPLRGHGSPGIAKDKMRLQIPDDEGDADADAEESGPDVSPGTQSARHSSEQRRKRANNRHPAPDTQTAPSTPMAPLKKGRSNILQGISAPPTERARPSFFPRRATMSELQDDVNHGVSEDEGRRRFQPSTPFRRGTGLGYHSRGLSNVGFRRQGQQTEGDETRPNPIRRMTGIGTGGEGSKGGKTPNASSMRWRQLKAGLKLLAQRKKVENTIDHAKSAELLAELTAGAPAALIFASMFQRDEHGNKRIPVLLEQLKVRITESRQVDYKSGDRHQFFKIELEYGNGMTRMSWTVWRSLRDFANLHVRYKVQINAQKFIQLKGDEARTKLPHFPRSTFPYLRGIRGLESESDEERENEGNDPDADVAQITVAQRASKIKKKKTRPPIAHRRKSSVASMGGDLQARRDAYPERQRKKLEVYLQQMIRYLVFRAESNRLCKFLELSALGVRLAAEGSYHGKEGLLVIKSGKGVDFRRAWTPTLFVSRHGPKWFCVRHSYVVCVDSPEEMNIYDVFLVDSNFRVSSKRQRLRDQQKAKDMAKVAKDSATHPQHHQIKLVNSERKIKLLAKNERVLRQFQESILYMCTTSPWSKPQRFESFAPVRSSCFAQWLVDGRDYMWNASRAISMAKDVIYIHDWWLSPELYMRRPAAISQKWRLDRLLQRKAREGVKVFVIMYRNINSAIPIDSEYSKFSLLDLHPNIFVQRSPNQFRQNTFFWAHHEKLCLIDHMVAFIGGIDLCFGRWDTPQHTVSDDKVTGFEPSEGPKDADHCQLWPGKDYSNPRVQDFFSLDKPYEEMYDRTKVGRMPWHDIHMQIVGQPARDLTRHFVQRWNYILRQRKPTRTTPFLLPPADFEPEELVSGGLEGTCEIQILRSAGEWSLGTPGLTEHSIMNAYIKLIEQSDHFIYIENQFFVSSCEVEGTRVENKIGDALVERIIRAASKNEAWHAVILIPLLPGFQNTVDQQDGTSVRLIMQCQFRSICRGEASIFGRVRAAGIEPEDYIQFYGLRAWGKIGPQKQLITEQLYIHAKCMIADDRVAIIGSANINERSMLGDRDSETAAVVRDTDMINSTMNGEPYLVGRFPHTLRVRLMREHLGIDVDEVMESERRRADADIYRSSEGNHNSDQMPLSDGAPKPQFDNLDNTKLEEMILKSEHMSSFNHDVDWEQAGNPNLRSKRKLTEDARVTNNLEHRKSVSGEGHDAMLREEQAGQGHGRDTHLQPTNHGLKEVLAQPEGPYATALKGGKESPLSWRSKQSEPSGLFPALPPESSSSPTDALPSLSQVSLPPLPITDDSDIGGPPIQRARAQTLLDIFYPGLADLKQPHLDNECMRDPILDAFLLDTWHAVAENNTRLYRQVFRCMPDNEVKTWKEYKEYAAYSERFSQAQGGGRLSDRVRRDASGASGPPGTPSTADKLKLLGPIGEKAGELELKAEGVSEKIKRSFGHTETNKYPLGLVEEWAAEANRAQEERHEQEAKAQEKDSEVIDEKSSQAEELKSLGSPKLSVLDGAELSSISQVYSPPSVNYSEALNRNTSAHKRRRRATTRSSRREFHASDDIIARDEAEDLMHMVQGHLVLWPYDWLLREEQGGNWLYSIDGLAPLEI